MPDSDDPGVVRRAPRLARMLGDLADAPVDHDRARGVLLGLAVGNLLGLPVEGQTRDAIRGRYPNGVREIDPRESERPMDDDLAQAIELAEAYAVDPGPIEGFARRLVEWRSSNGRGVGVMTSRVIDYLEVGLGVPDAARAFWREHGCPLTQPNGALMRCAAVALRFAHDPGALIAQSAASCSVTHYAPGAQWSCIVVNVALAMLLRGASPEREELSFAAASDGAPAELVAWMLAVPRQIEDRIAEERVSGHTYLCAQAALWCLDSPDNFEESLIRIVSAGGDTDTNGAVAGTVLGARYGASMIPLRWLERIPQRARIEAVTESLLA